MQNKIILDLCGGTGAWSRPYKEAGYDVLVITLPEHDVRDVYFGNDSMHFHGQTEGAKNRIIQYSNVYGILAAPPCTEFSLAKNGSPTPRNLYDGLQPVRACMDIIWECVLRGAPMFWALENPLGLLRKFLGRPEFTFRQWEFGDMAVKPTDIWGWFNNPKKTVSEMPEGITKRYKSGKVNSFCWTAPSPPDWLDATGLTRADLRSITPAGFAQAFFKANR